MKFSSHTFRVPAVSFFHAVSLISAAALVAVIGLGTPIPALAQATPAPGTQASVSKQSPVAKPSKAASKKKAAAQPEPEPEVVVAAADEQQLAAAKEVLLGESGCEFNQKIQVDASATHPGYVDMSFNKKKYTMKPILSPTGALRLEDVRSEALMIQIASKTMVMNQKTGQRLVDNCVHPDQSTVTADTTPVLMK
ncbi:MAG: hypothetical protein H0T52_04415 [Lautropia sp.]|nr:hypothetical protein [Lautropia sp.]